MARLSAALVAVFLCLTSTAFAQSACGERAIVLAKLAENHGEEVRIRAVSERGLMMEITVNEESGSYSVLLTQPGGVTCLADAGYSFETVEPVAKPKGTAM